LSRRISESPNSNPGSRIFGVFPYVDPKKIVNTGIKQPFKLNKESDVYSVGVLLWEISSGEPPFYTKNEPYDINLAIAISRGLRETIVPDTPVGYSDLYKGKYIDNRISKYYFFFLFFFF